MNAPRPPAPPPRETPRRRSPVVSSWLPLLVLVSVLAASPLWAQSDRSDRFAFSAGSFGVLDDMRSEEIGFEYRFGPRAFQLRPLLGVTVTSEDAGYVVAGLRRDFGFGGRWTITPFTGVTLYEKGDAIDLGQVVEFRSGLELAYRLDDRSRLGLSFYHLSNAGLSDHNPGSESLALVYSFR